MVISLTELMIDTSLNKGSKSHQASLKSTGSQSVQKDITKPNGEACNADGTLKDASKIIWVHSPTGSNSSPIPFLKHAHNDSNEDEVTVKKKTCVSTKH